MSEVKIDISDEGVFINERPTGLFCDANGGLTIRWTADGQMTARVNWTADRDHPTPETSARIGSEITLPKGTRLSGTVTFP